MRKCKWFGSLAVLIALLLGTPLGAWADTAVHPPFTAAVVDEGNQAAFPVDGQLAVEFDMNLDLSTVQRGQVTLSGGSGRVQYVRILPDAPRRVEIGFRDLSYRTEYTVHISGMKNRLGAEMEPLTTQFTTQPFGQSQQPVIRLTVTPGAYAGGQAMLLYSLPVTASALDTKNYRVTGGLRRVQSAELAGDRAVIVTFDAPLEPASSYTLHVDNIVGTDGQTLSGRCVFLQTPDTALQLGDVTLYRDYGQAEQAALLPGKLQPGNLTLVLSGVENNTGSQANAVAIAALYCGDRLVQAVQAPLPRAVWEGAPPAVTLPVTVPDDAAYTLALLVWDVNTLTPLQGIQTWSTEINLEEKS